MLMQSPKSIYRLALTAVFLVHGSNSWGQGAGGGNNDAMLLLLEQNRNLQAEVQALRGLVEEQGFEIRKLQRESLDRYTDTDTRLRNLEQMIAGGGAVTGLAGPGYDSVSPDSTPAAAGTGTVSGNPGLASGQNDGVTSNASGVTAGGSDNRFLPGSSGAVASGASGSATGIQRGGVADNSNTVGGVSQSTRTTTTRDPLRPAIEPTVLTEQQLYQMAYDSAINSQFERAIAEFDQYLNIHPRGRFTTNAHYWKGQSYLYLGRYDEAIAEYDIILQQYPDDAKVPDAMYGQAVAYEGIGEVQRAAQLLRQIMRNYPNTGVANLADTRLRSLN